MDDRGQNYNLQHQQMQRQQYHTDRLIVDDDDDDNDEDHDGGDDNISFSTDQQDSNENENYRPTQNIRNNNLLNFHYSANNNNNNFNNSNNKALSNTNYGGNRRRQQNQPESDTDEDTLEQRQQQRLLQPPRPSSVCHSEDGQAPSTISFNSGCYSLLASWKHKKMRQQQSKANSTLTTTSRASSTLRPESTLSSYISNKLRITKPKRAPLGLSQHYVTDSRRRRRANELILRTIEARRRLMTASPTYSTMTDNTMATGRHSYSNASQQPSQATSPTAIHKYGNTDSSTSGNTINNNNINNRGNRGNNNDTTNDYYTTSNYMTSSPINITTPKSTPSPRSPITSPKPSHRLKQQQQQRRHSQQPPLARLDDNTSSESDEQHRGSDNRVNKLSQKSKLLRRHLSTSNISVSSSSNSSASTSASLSHLVTDEQKEDLPDCIMRSSSSMQALQREIDRNDDLSLRARRSRQSSQKTSRTDNDSKTISDTPTVSYINNSTSNNSNTRQNKRSSRPVLRRDSMRRMRLLTTSSPSKPLRSMLQETISQSQNTKVKMNTVTYGQNMGPRGPLAQLNNKDQTSVSSQNDFIDQKKPDATVHRIVSLNKDGGLKLNQSNIYTSRSSDRSDNSKLNSEESRSKKRVLNEREQQQQTNDSHDNVRVSDFYKAKSDSSRSNPNLIKSENQRHFSPKPSSTYR